MTDLTRLIWQRREELSQLEKQIADLADRHDQILIELRTLRGASDGLVAPRVNMGKSEGCISNKWVRVLAEIITLPRPAFHSDFVDVARRNGMRGEKRNVYERIRTMKKRGILRGDLAQGFFVTPYAIDRFRLNPPKLPDPTPPKRR